MQIQGSEGFYTTRKGEFVPNYSLMFEKSHQKKWSGYLNKWIKTWSLINKGKKNPCTVQIDLNKEIFADLVKLKLVEVFKKDSKFKTSPSFFSQFYKSSQYLYFQVSFTHLKPRLTILRTL